MNSKNKKSDSKNKDQPQNLEEVLDALDSARQNEGGKEISVGDVMDGIGARSFGPLLVLPALIGMTPAGVIPGLPSLLAIIILLVAGQMLFGMDRVWIPAILEKRTVEAKRLKTAISKARPFARFVDTFLKSRLTFLTRGPFLSLILILCVAAALIIPFLELLPFAAAIPNGAIVAFGLSIIARDGVLAILAVLLAGGSIVLVVSAFLA